MECFYPSNPSGEGYLGAEKILKNLKNSHTLVFGSSFSALRLRVPPFPPFPCASVFLFLLHFVLARIVRVVYLYPSPPGLLRMLRIHISDQIHPHLVWYSVGQVPLGHS